MIRIVLVGDIGSGKSYFSKLFKFPVFNADLEVTKIYGKDKMYSLVEIPGKTNIFLNQFEGVQLVYNNENLKIAHVGAYIDMNINKCLKE